MNRFFYNHMFPLSVFILVSLCFAAKPNLTTGSTFKNFYWTQATEGGVKNGCYGYTKVDSTITSGNTLLYPSKFWFPTYKWWHALIPATYLTSTMKFSSQKPARISRAPDHFASVPWFTGFSRADTLRDTIQFFFPLLPQNAQYGRYDYFTIDVDAATDLEFYGAGDSIMVGSFVDKKPAPNGAVSIVARNAIIVELTKSNPLRIKSIRCKGEFKERISAYLGYDITKFSKNATWYGIDFIDTVPSVPIILVHSITVPGSKPLTAGETSTIRWSLKGASLVDSCLIAVRFDSTKTWESTGKTGKDSSFTWTAPQMESKTVFIKITACGQNGERISAISSMFSTAVQHTFMLQLQPYGNSSIIATWNPSSITTPKAQSVYLAYRTGSAAEKITESDLDTSRNALTTAEDTLTGLEAGKMYYVTAFVRDSAGNFSIPGPRAIDSARAEDRTPPQNSYTLSGSSTDSTHITLQWSSSSASTDINSIGIWYSTLKYPTTAFDTAAKRATQITKTDSTTTIAGLLPGTPYYCALFVADSAGNWSTNAQKATVQIRTKSSSTSADTANVIALTGTDTQTVLSGSLKIWSSNLKTAVYDTIDTWTVPTLTGFFDIGPSFSFRTGLLPAGASVSMKISLSDIPEPFTADAIQMYRFNIYTGAWRLEEGSIVVDSVAQTVTITTTNINLPFNLMIDTQPPVIITSPKDTVSYLRSAPITDTFTVTDNIENTRITLLAGSGHLSPSDISLYAVPGKSSGVLYTTIPAYVADPLSGLRSTFLVSDGRNTQSINLSRPIRRTPTNSDDRDISAGIWTPLFTTAQPDSPVLSSRLATSKNSTSYQYDKNNERILQWLPTVANRKDTDKWVEYSEANDSLFIFSPGKLFWLKSRNDLRISYGDATIPALIDTIGITLPSNEWTDFSNPYNFAIYTGDIINATAVHAATAGESVEIYQWIASKNSYHTEPLFLPGINNISNGDDTLSGASAFAAFNTAKSAITLQVPPTCVPLSAYNLQKKKAQNILAKKTPHEQWCVKLGFSTQKGVKLSPMYCAAKTKEHETKYFRQSPGMQPLTAAVIDEATGLPYGHAASGDLATGGATFRLIFSNSSQQSETLLSNILTATDLPQGVTSHLYYKNERRALQPGDSIAILVPANSKSTGYLIVGTDAYLNTFIKKVSAKFSFIPFTYNSSLKIHYSLPTEVKELAISLYDLKGRRLKHMVKTTGLQAGAGSLIWNETITAGYYIVEMRAHIKGTNQFLKLNRRWMYVH